MSFGTRVTVHFTNHPPGTVTQGKAKSLRHIDTYAVVAGHGRVTNTRPIRATATATVRIPEAVSCCIAGIDLGTQGAIAAKPKRLGARIKGTEEATGSAAVSVATDKVEGAVGVFAQVKAAPSPAPNLNRDHRLASLTPCARCGASSIGACLGSRTHSSTSATIVFVRLQVLTRATTARLA